MNEVKTRILDVRTKTDFIPKATAKTKTNNTGNEKI